MPVKRNQFIELSDESFPCEGAGHNDLMIVEWAMADPLVQDAKDSRRVRQLDIDRAVAIVANLKTEIPPVLVSGNTVLAGWLIVLAARKLGLKRIRVIRFEGLSPTRQRMVSAAINRLWELGHWDDHALSELILEFEATVPDFEPMQIGWSTTEADLIIGADQIDGAADDVPALSKQAVAMLGEVFLLGEHRIGCLNATCPEAYGLLMAGREADMVSADPPYGIPVNGFVAKRGKHREFVEGSGEKSDQELLEFFGQFLIACHASMRAGGLFFGYIDWRGQFLLQQAAVELFGKLLNLCVWRKDRAGMGSFYRSQHELVLVYKKPGAQHTNNIQLGRHGRDRSNVWDYPSAMSTRKGREGDLLADHPTPKNVAMIMDSILDCTARGDLVLDPFAGSGATLIAAERTGRICYTMDLDPLYVDVAIRRWQRWTGQQAVHAETGESFDALAAKRLAGGSGHE